MLISSDPGDTLSMEDIDAKIESLSHEITLIHKEIKRLKAYKNRRLPTVSKLIPEVFSAIFELLALSATSPLGPTRYPYRDLLSATQVCHSWRQIALDSPRIWGYISSSAPHRISELFLDRSASAPLYLWRDGFSWECEKTVRATLDHLDRLEEITLECRSNWAQKSLQMQEHFQRCATFPCWAMSSRLM